MRVPTEAPLREQGRRRSVWILAVLAAIVVLLIVIQGASGFYINYLWFRATGIESVWRVMLSAKLGLGAVFVVIGFVMIWSNLWLVEKIAPRALFLAPETEFVRRYQAVVTPHAFALRTVVSFFLGLALGSGTSSQWQNWLLFGHSVTFGRKDPLFHRDASFFVFQLPFLSFLVDWVLVALVVTLLVSVVGHFLNGAIRVQGRLPRVEPRALAHVSLLLGLMALVRAWAYYFVDRFTLALAHDGVVAGASYTDIHVRLPAMTMLAIVSLAAFVILIVNVYQRTLVLPAIAAGLWAFLAIVLGVVYPALVQALRVTPSQSTLELHSIANNIQATNYSMGIDKVAVTPFPVNNDLKPGDVQRYHQVLADASLWDPALTSSTFTALQGLKAYYQLTPLALDRYRFGGTLAPVVVTVRGLSSAGVPSPSWVNSHLQFTHGEGAVVASSTSADSQGNPSFLLGNLPPQASAPGLSLSKSGARVYFAPGQSQYVIGNSRQREVDYQTANGASAESSYNGQGIGLGSFFVRLAAAVHLRDFNLLVSKLITPRSKLIFEPDVRARAASALPFLTVDTNPYAVVANGQLYWMLDAYATTSYYPDAQQADTTGLPGGSALAGGYDYVRDAVKIVENATTGQMSYYVLPGAGPMMTAYGEAFPHLFQPLSRMPAALLAHLRYPQDLMNVQSAMYGRYHVTVPGTFYASSQAWQLAESSTSVGGSPRGGLAGPYQPNYELLQLPGDNALSFDLVEPLVPYSPQGQYQTLSSLMVASSTAASYGELQALDTPNSRSIKGPGLVNAAINSNKKISSIITPLDLSGSAASLGTLSILPIADSLIYIRPLYVSSSQTSFPQLQDVIVVYSNTIEIAPTLSQALAGVFGSNSTGGGSGGGATGGGSSASISAQVRQLIAQASADYQAASAALSSGQLGAYQGDVQKAASAVAKADQLLASSSTTTSPKRTKSTGSSSSTTTTPSAKGATTTTTNASTTSATA